MPTTTTERQNQLIVTNCQLQITSCDWQSIKQLIKPADKSFCGYAHRLRAVSVLRDEITRRDIVTPGGSLSCHSVQNQLRWPTRLACLNRKVVRWFLLTCDPTSGFLHLLKSVYVHSVRTPLFKFPRYLPTTLSVQRRRNFVNSLGDATELYFIARWQGVLK